MSQASLGIFVKHPTPGQVKTRLAARIGADAASSLYQCFIQDTLATFETLMQRHCEITPIIAFAPNTDQSRTFFQKLSKPRWKVWPQPEGDLGSRMTGFFQHCFEEGSERVVLIGSDSPTISVSMLEQAFELLKTNDVVLGPAFDGGYYLVGLGKPWFGLFEDIEWSSESVFSQTLQRIHAAGRSLGLLPPWYDVDEWPTLKLLAEQLSAEMHATGSVTCPATYRWLTGNAAEILPVKNAELR